MKKKALLIRLRRGSNGIAFLALFPILAASIFLANDFARALILQQRLRQVADGCALAAAGALDEGKMLRSQDNFELNPQWAQDRANNITGTILATGGSAVPGWMNIGNCQLTIDNSDNSVLVNVNGSVVNAFAGGIGAPGGFGASATSKAKAATGISSDNW